MDRQRPAGESTSLWAQETQDSHDHAEIDEAQESHAEGSLVEIAVPGRRPLRVVIGASLIGVTLLLSALLVVAGLSHQHSRATATNPPRGTPQPERDATLPAVSREKRPATEPPLASPDEVAVGASVVAAVKPDEGQGAPAPDEENAAASSEPGAPPSSVPRPARVAGDDF